ncbi:hypothetical protein OOJ91_12170 [Micromonospora lupini]|uniref:hypothetical protein n=1 Tax=Micromonospora lupini TaxID=285679 RepID=UPI002251EBAD|nr:hypothetical protein [Micromonospora lupini]MCX5066634.1 hypothetical protein [Micromonospora lupini]
MTDFRTPWAHPLDALGGIPIVVDAEVPPGTGVFDLDPAEPRHIVRVRSAATTAAEVRFTADQHNQIRDHYQAMDERAGRLLAQWRALERFAAAAVPEPPRPPFLGI